MERNMEPSVTCPSCKSPLAKDTPLGGLCAQCLIRSGFYSGAVSQPEPAGGRGQFDAPPLSDLTPWFPQLEILGLIGRGGMGAVYKARQPRLDRLVALKILAGERDEGSSPFANRFAREAQALARMNHPNIVTVYDFGEAGGFYYLLMEFVDGLNLRQLEYDRKLTAAEALAIVPPICDALHYAHGKGIVHRDIKPENILLDRQGRVKIADFGIAKLMGTASEKPLTGDDQRVGTPHYMAPEQVEKPATVDHRADIYSLGVVFYEMLTGELPLGRFASPSQKARIDVRLDAIVLRALAKEPELRFQKVSDIKTLVEALAARPVRRPPSRSALPALASQKVRAHRPSPKAVAAGAWRRIRAVSARRAALAAALVVFAALVLWLIRPGRGEAVYAGAVTDAKSGWPVAGAVVSVRIPPRENSIPLDATHYDFVPGFSVSETIAQAETDAKGAYELSVPEGAFRLATRDDSGYGVGAVLEVTAPGYTAQTRWGGDLEEYGFGFRLNQGPARRPPPSPSPNRIEEAAAARNPVLAYASGVRAELVAVAAHPRDGRVWSADGTPRSGVPGEFEKSVFAMEPPYGDQIGREFYVVIDGLPQDRSVDVRYELDGNLALTGTPDSRSETSRILLGFCATLLGDLRQTVARIGIAAGPWKTIAEGPVTAASGFSSDSHDGTGQYSVMVSAPVFVDGRLRITVSDNSNDKNPRIVLIDSAGLKYPGRLAESSAGTKFRQTTFQFDAVTSDVRIARGEFQLRDYEWQSFPAIQLQPHYGAR